MKKRLMSILLALFMVWTLLPISVIASTQGVKILSYPTKTTYKLGEGFDTTGLNAVININGVDKNVNNKITFYTSKTVELTQGRPWTVAGNNRVVEIRYEGKKVAEYKVTVTADSTSAPAAPATTTPQVKILSYPTKIAYKLGEGFDTTGLNAVINTNGVDKNVNDKITFYTSETVELKQGRPWAVVGNNRVVEIRYEGKKVAEYTVGVFTVAPPSNLAPGMYRVSGSDGTGSQPIYKGKGDVEPVGAIPSGTIAEVTESENNWVKVKFKGREYYMTTHVVSVHGNGLGLAMVKVDGPDIVCSPWAKEWLSYTGSYIGTAGEWSNPKEDWTKPITNEEMAELLVDIMKSIYTDFSVAVTLPGAFKGADEGWDIPSGDPYGFSKSRLYYWGIVPVGGVNWKAEATYGDFTSNLIKLMAYDRKLNREGSGLEFTKAALEKFAIGGDTRANAKITVEQAKILCDKLLYWYEEWSFAREMKYQQEHDFNNAVGETAVGTGIYTIKALIGTKPNQPHLAINGEGKGELNNGKAQNFKITYKKNFLDPWGTIWPSYTIQTMDGKFLALSGDRLNGSRLITQDKEYLWRINSVGSEDYQWAMSISSMDNTRQFLNASASGTANGTPIITWYWGFGERGLTPVPRNCQFIFEYVGKVSDFPAVPK
ncbi:MAG: hypothetical protein AB2421_06110 [Thermotaleaceae bacterium]